MPDPSLVYGGIPYAGYDAGLEARRTANRARAAAEDTLYGSQSAIDALVGQPRWPRSDLDPAAAADLVRTIGGGDLSPAGPPGELINRTQVKALGGDPNFGRSAAEEIASHEEASGVPTPPQTARQNETGLDVGDATSGGLEHHIRYQLPGGQWREYNAGGATQAARMGAELPNYDPGPMVSQIDVRDQPWGQQPESWHEDPLEQSAQAAELKRNQVLAADPFAQEHSQLAAQLGLYAGRQSIDEGHEARRRQQFLQEADQEATNSAAAKAAIDRNQAIPAKDKELRKVLVDQRYRERMGQLAISHGYAKETIAQKGDGGMPGF